MYVAETFQIWNLDFEMLTWSRTGVLKKIAMLNNVIFAENSFSELKKVTFVVKHAFNDQSEYFQTRLQT